MHTIHQKSRHKCIFSDVSRDTTTDVCDLIHSVRIRSIRWARIRLLVSILRERLDEVLIMADSRDSERHLAGKKCNL